MNNLIDRQALCDDLREYKVHPVPVSSDESEVKGYNDGIDLAISVIAGFPSAEPEQKMRRKFLEIITEYPKICTYPEYEGKPYYSIKYEENGEIIVGFGTYKPEVLSQYLHKYFISSVEPERKKGEWINGMLYYDFDESEWEKVKCSVCKNFVTKQIFYHDNKYHYCPYCGADMRGE